MDTGLRNVALATAITVMIGLPSLTFVKNPVVQAIGLWAALLIAIRAAFEFTPNPLKIAALSAAVIVVLQLIQLVVRGVEKFETEDTLGCSTACDLDYSQPEKRLDQRVDRLLSESDKIVKDMEDYLHGNTPDERAAA